MDKPIHTDIVTAQSQTPETAESSHFRNGALSGCKSVEIMDLGPALNSNRIFTVQIDNQPEIT